MDKFRLIDSYYNKNEIIITEDDELRNILKGFLIHGTRVLILKSPNSGSLTLGIGDPYGFVEYMNESAEPPYLIAIRNKTESPDSFIEFDAGGTSTPINVNRCLPFENVMDIAIYFFKNERLPDYVKWESV